MDGERKRWCSTLKIVILMKDKISHYADRHSAYNAAGATSSFGISKLLFSCCRPLAIIRKNGVGLRSGDFIMQIIRDLLSVP